MQEAVDFDMNTLPFMTNRMCSVYGIPDCRVTRCGYTGEDGVEVGVIFIVNIIILYLIRMLSNLIFIEVYLPRFPLSS